MLWISTTIGALAGLIGMYLSYHLDVSSGATIVLVNFVAFATVYSATANQRSRPGQKAAVPVSPLPMSPLTQPNTNQAAWSRD
jgi:uncharacterized membrane protein YjjP (DUF1212 family)